jgi:hypothetical protein
VEKEETFLVLSTPKEDQGYPIELIPADGSDKTNPAPGRTAPRNDPPRPEES